MKTLLFTLEYPPFNGGVANYYGNMAKYWPITEKLLVLDNNRHELMKEKGIIAWWPSFFALKRKLARDKFDNLLVGQILPLGTVAYLVSLFTPVKYVVFLHGMDLAYALKHPRKKWLSKIILNHADKIICANSYVREKLLEFMPESDSKTLVINPGIEGGAPDTDPNDILEIQKKYNLTDKTVLLSLGRLVKRKGFDRTIEALTKLPAEDRENLIYFIAGVGPREEYLKKLVPNSLSDKIIFLGSLSQTEKWTWMKRCDIFIMPSRDISGDFEGFGIVYLEANLCGKPVIAGNSGGVRDAVINEYNGLLVDPNDISALSRAVMRLANNPQLREQLGEQGKLRAIRDFDWENQTKKIWQFIKQ